MAAALQEAVSGAAGGVVSTACTYPLDVVKTRLQAQRRCKQPSQENGLVVPEAEASCGDVAAAVAVAVAEPAPYRGFADCLARIIREEGPGSLFKGLRFKCGQAALTNFVFFYLLRALRPILGRVAFLQGVGAGVGVQLVVLPIDMVVTRLQITRAGAGAGSFAEVLRDIVRREGFFGLWAGLGPGLCLVLNPGITQLVHAWLRKGTKNLTALRAFWFGAVAKAVACIVTYPYVRAKVRLQTHGMHSKPGSGELPGTTLKVIAGILAESGLLGLYDGLSPQLTNAVFKEALLTMSRVKINLLVEQVFRVLLASSRSR
jgi:hypothetical protein